ncbi:MAG: tonB-system energizer ExbB [Stenotrophomonas sp.]
MHYDESPLAAAAHSLTPWSMYQAADGVVQTVMILLALASLVTWTILIAKTVELVRAGQQLRAARHVLNDSVGLISTSAEPALQQGLALQMLDAARTELRLSADACKDVGIKERLSSRLERIELAVSRQLRAGIGVLASIGAVAPFVGLFGTVWGIMNSFVGIAASNTTNLAVVAPGIAEALLATAMGLVAAIPAVVIYNYFSRRLTELRALAGDISASIQQIVSRDLDRGQMPSHNVG